MIIIYFSLLISLLEQEYMPLPPNNEENGENTEESEPKLEFTYVESLMYAFHQLARQSREFITEDADRTKDFRARYLTTDRECCIVFKTLFLFRLQYFARGVQGYMKKLRESLQGKSGDDLKDEESRIKVTALRTTSNINSLIRDLFRNPPAFKATVTLSFKPPTQVSHFFANWSWDTHFISHRRPQRLQAQQPKQAVNRPEPNATHPSHSRARHRKHETTTTETRDSSTSFRPANSRPTSTQTVNFSSNQSKFFLIFFFIYRLPTEGTRGIQRRQGIPPGGLLNFPKSFYFRLPNTSTSFTYITLRESIHRLSAHWFFFLH